VISDTPAIAVPEMASAPPALPRRRLPEYKSRVDESVFAVQLPANQGAAHGTEADGRSPAGTNDQEDKAEQFF
jgi:hypothetical protein